MGKRHKDKIEIFILFSLPNQTPLYKVLAHWTGLGLDEEIKSTTFASAKGTIVNECETWVGKKNIPKARLRRNASLWAFKIIIVTALGWSSIPCWAKTKRHLTIPPLLRSFQCFKHDDEEIPKQHSTTTTKRRTRNKQTSPWISLRLLMIALKAAMIWDAFPRVIITTVVSEDRRRRRFVRPNRPVKPVSTFPKRNWDKS